MNNVMVPFRAREGYVRSVCLIACYLVCLMMLGSLPVYGADSQDGATVNPIRQESVYVGVNYPGITLGYRADYYNLELRGFSQDDIQIIGPRFMYKFYRFRGGNLYWALDAYYVQYEDVITEGTGQVVGPMFGLEKFLGTSFSLTVDGGPYYVNVKDDLSGLSSSGIQFTLNMGFNIHF
jgi:hypothetical protein